MLTLPSDLTSETRVEYHGKSTRLWVRRCGSQAQIFLCLLNTSSPLSFCFLNCVLEIIAIPTTWDFGKK